MHFIDTSIQVYRAFDQPWFDSKLEDAFVSDLPVLTDYVRREFRHTVERAFDTIIELIKNVHTSYGFRGDDQEIKIFIGDCLRGLTTPNKYRSDRNIKLSLQILAHLLDNHSHFLDGRTVDDLIFELETWRETLTQGTFFKFRFTSGVYDIRPQGYREVFSCPLANRDYTCARGKFECNVQMRLSDTTFKQVLRFVQEQAQVYKKLRSLNPYRNIGKREELRGSSIGQSCCFPLGDLYHISFAMGNNCTIVSSDKELCAVSAELGIPTLQYHVLTKELRLL